MEFFARGKRSVVYTDVLDGRRVAIKVKRKDSKAIFRIENEANWLKRLNKYGIGPKFISFEDGKLVMEFVEGERFLDWLENAEKSEVEGVLKEIFRQVRRLDLLRVDKEEMHRPVKHILIGDCIKMIDFERCHVVDKPKNLTQFCQFLMSKKMSDMLVKKGFKRVDHVILRGFLKEYKKKGNGASKVIDLFVTD